MKPSYRILGPEYTQHRIRKVGRNSIVLPESRSAQASVEVHSRPIQAQAVSAGVRLPGLCSGTRSAQALHQRSAWLCYSFRCRRQSTALQPKLAQRGAFDGELEGTAGQFEWKKCHTLRCYPKSSRKIATVWRSALCIRTQDDRSTHQVLSTSPPASTPAMPSALVRLSLLSLAFPYLSLIAI
jgi:hypothetical protein